MGVLVVRNNETVVMSPNKRVESDSLRRRFAPPPLPAHAQRYAA